MLTGSTPAALEGLRVLDLTGQLGNYCGKLFADLGADVILVEPPAGVDTRHAAPFLDETPGQERSLVHAYVNAGKRGIVLDLEKAGGRADFAHLLQHADLLIDSLPADDRVRMGLDADALFRLNPRLVRTTITPFGLTGPYAKYAADDLTILALGGLLYLGGYHDGPPVAAYGHQAYAATGLFAAVASMAAVYETEATGRGESIDVSAQEVMVMAMENAVQFFELEGTVRKRYGGQQRLAGAGVFQCRDGYFVLLAGGIGANRFWQRFIEWMQAEKVEGAEIFTEPHWLENKYLKTDEAKAAFAKVFHRYAMAHDRAHLYDAGRKWQIPLAPIVGPEQILQSPQLAHRGFFVESWNAARGANIKLPGAPYILSATPWRQTRPAPALGEHTEAVFSDPAWSAASDKRISQ